MAESWEAVPHNETLDIAGPAGRLEALLMFPDADARAAAVVCHAHPLHGGMMHFKAVFRAAKALQSAGDFTDFEKKKKVRLKRPDGTSAIVNCVKARENPKLDLPVYPGDTIFVPRRKF